MGLNEQAQRKGAFECHPDFGLQYFVEGNAGNEESLHLGVCNAKDWCLCHILACLWLAILVLDSWCLDNCFDPQNLFFCRLISIDVYILLCWKGRYNYLLTILKNHIFDDFHFRLGYLWHILLSLDIVDMFPLPNSPEEKSRVHSTTNKNFQTYSIGSPTTIVLNKRF